MLLYCQTIRVCYYDIIECPVQKFWCKVPMEKNKLGSNAGPCSTQLLSASAFSSHHECAQLQGKLYLSNLPDF